MAKKSKGAATQKQRKKRPEKRDTRGEMKYEDYSSLARPDQQAGGPENHGLDADEDRNP